MSRRPATMPLLLAALALWSAGCSAPSPPQAEDMTLRRAAASFTIANTPAGGAQR